MRLWTTCLGCWHWGLYNLQWCRDNSTDGNIFSHTPLNKKSALAKHTLTDTKNNDCEDSDCSGHNDPNEVIGLQFTVTGPSQVTVNFLLGNIPSQKGFITQNLASVLVDRLNSQPIWSCATNDHPTHTLHPMPGTTSGFLTRKDRHPTPPSCSYFSVSYIPPPTYVTDILSCELSIIPKSVAATNTL